MDFRTLVIENKLYSESKLLSGEERALLFMAKPEQELCKSEDCLIALMLISIIARLLSAKDWHSMWAGLWNIILRSASLCVLISGIRSSDIKDETWFKIFLKRPEDFCTPQFQAG